MAKEQRPNQSGLVYTRYITRNGKRIYHPGGGVFVFTPKEPKK